MRQYQRLRGLQARLGTSSSVRYGIVRPETLSNVFESDHVSEGAKPIAGPGCLPVLSNNCLVGKLQRRRGSPGVTVMSFSRALG